MKEFMTDQEIAEVMKQVSIGYEKIASVHNDMIKEYYKLINELIGTVDLAADLDGVVPGQSLTIIMQDSLRRMQELISGKS